MARKPRDAAAVCFGLKFADIHHKCKSSLAPKATLQSSRHTGAKTEFNVKWPLKVIHFGVTGKPVRDYIILLTLSLKIPNI